MDGNGSNLAKPTAAQAAWQDLELGLMIGMDIGQFDMSEKPDGLSFGESYPAKLFNPAKLDCDQWMEVCKLFGAKYTVMTSKGGSGFLQWQSEAYDYGMREAVDFQGGKGDIVKEYVESAAKYGIKTGFYNCLHWNSYLSVVHNGKLGGGFIGKDTPEEKAHYAKQCEQMLVELLTRYGEVTEMWFDGAYRVVEDGGPDLYPIFEKYGPDVMYFQANDWSSIRWCGNEDGCAGDPCWATVDSTDAALNDRGQATCGKAGGATWLPPECDTMMPGRWWGWQGEEKMLAIDDPVDKLIEMYYNTVGRNANFLLELVIGPDGLPFGPDIQYYERFGREIQRRFGTPLDETSGEGRDVTLELKQPAKIDHVIVMENILEGERIREFVVEGLTPGNEWQPLCEGTSVGHKRILRFDPTEAAQVRLKVTKQAATPKIRKLAVYDVAGS